MDTKQAYGNGSVVYLSATAIFYLSEIYGTWRTAKYYQPPKQH